MMVIESTCECCSENFQYGFAHEPLPGGLDIKEYSFLKDLREAF